MNRRRFLKLSAATALAAAAPGSVRAAPPPRNLLFVMADQWRSTAFGHAGSRAPLLSTPVLDRLAREGVRCTRAYAANPECSPSRASVLTGRLPHQHGVVENNLMLPPSEVALPSRFREAGYATHYIGKWHLDGPAKPGFVPPGWRRHGFETFEGFNRGHTYDRFTSFTNEGERLDLTGFEPTWQTDRAIEFLRSHRARPFLCFLSFGAPHARVNELTPDLRDASSDYAWRPNVPSYMRRLDLLQRKLLDYYALCSRLDVEIGRLLGELEALGLSEQTVVVFTSDHGDMLGSHGQMNKEYPYEEALRVPLLLRAPDLPAHVSEAPISGVDLMPTLSSLCGVPSPEGCAGVDVSASLRTGAEGSAREVYAAGRMTKLEGRNPAPGKVAWRALVTAKHKLVFDARGGVALLVDLEKDPYEMKNLAGERAHAAVERELSQRLTGWIERTNDPFPAAPRAALESYPDPDVDAPLGSTVPGLEQD